MQILREIFECRHFADLSDGYFSNHKIEKTTPGKQQKAVQGSGRVTYSANRIGSYNLVTDEPDYLRNIFNLNFYHLFVRSLFSDEKVEKQKRIGFRSGFYSFRSLWYFGPIFVNYNN